MMTIFQRIVEQANETKRRKQEQNDAFISTRTFRQNEKQSSQFSSDDHQSEVDDYGGKVQDSLRTRATEHEAIKVAGGLATYEQQPPLIDRPNKYTNLKFCGCKDHEGERWVNRSQFTYDGRMSDKLHAYCKKCRAAQARFAYTPKWKRGV